MSTPNRHQLHIHVYFAIKAAVLDDERHVRRDTSIYYGGHLDISVDWADRFGSFRSLVRVDHVRSSDVAVLVVVGL